MCKFIKKKSPKICKIEKINYNCTCEHCIHERNYPSIQSVNFTFFIQKHMKTKHVVSGLLGAVAVIAFAVLTSNNTMAANTNTNTTLGIRTGNLTFVKDTGASMDSYFGHAANQNAAIDIGSYDSSLSAIAAASSGDHRFTVTDLAGKTFAVTVVSSDLTAADGTIDKALISYTSTNRLGTGKALTATGNGGQNLGSSVTFVGRANNSGVSKYSQEITIHVAVPAAQAPGDYTGVLTFTY